MNKQDTSFVHDSKENFRQLRKSSSSDFRETTNSFKTSYQVDTSKTNQSQLKYSTKSYNTSRFKNLKIDTGEVVLNKKGLVSREEQFLKTNNFSTPGNPDKINSKDYHFNPLQQNFEKTLSLPKETVTKELKDVDTYSKNQGNKTSTIVNSAKELNENNVLESGKNNLTGAKKVYSEKYKKKLYDSLGLRKADSIFNVVSAFSKKEVSKEDLLQSINSSFPSDQKLNNAGLNTSQEALQVPDEQKINSLPTSFDKSDLAKVKLPADVLTELPPIHGKQVDKTYMKLVDSMRQINLKTENLKMKEETVNKDIKAAVFKEKESFLHKSYIEGVVGYLQTGKVTLFQASPSFGYHFTDYLSLGIGPNVLVKYEDKKFNASVGLRYFSKIEFFQRRAYLQAEDNIMPANVNTEYVNKSGHAVLIGGGVLLPITKSVALNPSLMYRISTTNGANNSGTPWVFRLGISSIKVKK
ncbi:MAG TPA: hypothetical protein VL443_01605 [Cyclobacteriaceae bacterium]|nr:hypothetical protein [Cyclobacteriaceae bacterium]